MIHIHDELKAASDGKLSIGVLTADVQVSEHDSKLWEEISHAVELLQNADIDPIAQLKELKALRQVYKYLGKDPARYRGSNEALIRRIRKGKGLYQVNTVVDINNLISLESRRSVGTFNLALIGEEIEFRPGQAGEPYEGIGRGPLNIEHLPVFADKQGPFGSTTSDSERVKITLSTSAIMTVIIAFDGGEKLEQQLERAAKLFEEYCSASKMDSHIVK